MSKNDSFALTDQTIYADVNDVNDLLERNLCLADKVAEIEKEWVLLAPFHIHLSYPF